MAKSTSLRPDMGQIFSVILDAQGKGSCGPLKSSFGWVTARIYCKSAAVTMKHGAFDIDAAGGVILDEGREYMDFADGQFLAFAGAAGTEIQVVAMERVD